MIQPRGMYVLIEPHQKEEKKGSIIIPDQWQIRPPEGKVVAVGAGEYKRKTRDENCWVKILPEIKVGDTIIYATHTSRFGAIPIKLDGKLFWLIDQRDILGILAEEVKT